MWFHILVPLAILLFHVLSPHLNKSLLLLSTVDVGCSKPNNWTTLILVLIILLLSYLFLYVAIFCFVINMWHWGIHYHYNYNWTYVRCRGYISPEYAANGLFSVKSDVFSFGVLVLEIVSGTKNRGFYHQSHHDNLLGHVSSVK